MAASTTHVHDFAQTAGGSECSLCGAKISQAEIQANKAAGMDTNAMLQYIHKKIKG